MTEVQRSKISVWIEAARLRTLPLSIAGIVTGSALAYEIEQFRLEVFIPALFTTLLLQILSNLANDFGDAQKGTDNEERIGPKRMVSSGLLSQKEMFNGIVLITTFALLSGTVLLYESFGPQNFPYALIFFILGLISIWAAIKYTVGKNAYGYYGFGDLFVMLFFGILAVAGSFFLYSMQISISAILQSLCIGSFSVGVLHLNNMRDQENDKNAGKSTMAVKLGPNNSKYYFLGLMLLGLGSAIADVALTALHITELIQLLIAIPIGVLLLKVWKVNDHREYNNFLKPLALSTFVYSLLLFLSFAL